MGLPIEIESWTQENVEEKQKRNFNNLAQLPIQM